MKRFKKLVAVLLACVMALTLLTACGGGASGGSSNSGEEVMKQLTAKINENVKDLGISMTYDTQLDKRAEVCGNVLLTKLNNGASEAEAENAAMKAAGLNNNDYYFMIYTPNGSQNQMDNIATVFSAQARKEYQANEKAGKKIGYAGMIDDSGNIVLFYALVECK